ncbi:MAG: calcium/sodium antiporter [Eubacteriales bacterium]|nr:calcium/sodium antiporter [Eubacteriales bacterium]
MIVVRMLLLALGFGMLVKGADWFVDATAGIARKYGIPQLVIGLTIVAMGTSLPEAAVSITAALEGNAEITIGNIVGSNILNIWIILGISSLIATLTIQKSTFFIEIPYMIFVTIVLMIMGMTGGLVDRVEGIILWLLFLVYLVYLFFLAKKGASDEQEEKRSSWLLLLLAVAGGVLIIWGSKITVDSARALAGYFGISERFIGLTIVALGTSLPELVTSVIAAKRGNADIAIGNIVGSNIFNILFVVGSSSLIIPTLFDARFVIDTAIAVFTGVVLWLAVFRTKTLARTWGIMMLAFYAIYFVYLL